LTVTSTQLAVVYSRNTIFQTSSFIHRASFFVFWTNLSASRVRNKKLL